jgi:hypothetical protein
VSSGLRRFLEADGHRWDRKGEKVVKYSFSGLNQSRVYFALLLFVLLFSGLQPSRAAETERADFLKEPVRCAGASIDLRQKGSSLHRVVPTDQGETNLCAFHAASQLVSAWSNQGTPSSVDRSEAVIDPVALAVDFAAETKWPYWMPIQNTTDPLTDRFGRWGGMVCPLVNSVRERGACTDAGLFSRFGAGSGEASDRSARVYRVVSKYALAKKRDQATLLQVLPGEFIQALQDETPSFEEYPLPSEEEIRQALLLHGRSPYRVMRALAFQDCAKKRTPPMQDLPECRSSVYAGLDLFGIRLKDDPSRSSEASEKIIEIIQQPGAMPVTVAHCGSVYEEGRSYRGRSILGSKCWMHWSLVIGMREEKDGSCSFLLRSSYDTEGKTYSPDWAMDSPGDAWVDARAFERSLYMLQWLGE